MKMKSPSSYYGRSASNQTSELESAFHSSRVSNHKTGSRGRPTLFCDRMVTVSFRIPASYATRIEEYTKRVKESKSEFFRRAIELALCKSDSDRKTALLADEDANDNEQ